MSLARRASKGNGDHSRGRPELPRLRFGLVLGRTEFPRLRYGLVLRRSRRGAASLDYVLLLGVILPMAAFILGIGPRIIALVYEMICVVTGWPFI